MSKTTKKPKSKVTRITVARLYNTGNYEHVRYEIGVEVPKGASAQQALIDTTNILAALKPGRVPDCRERLAEAQAKPEESRSSWEKEKLSKWAEEMSAYMGRCAERREAIKRLDDIGGSSKHTDAKKNWQDDDELF